MINADKPHLWKADIAASVDLFNDWFLQFAPQTYQETRALTTEAVREALDLLHDMRTLSPETLKVYPIILPTLRMSTAPPIARDRLIGLAGVSSNLVKALELGHLPSRMPISDLDAGLVRICDVIVRLLDRDIFPWLSGRTEPTEMEKMRASTIVADRLCGAQSDPLIRNAQEQRQFNLIEQFLTARGYRKQASPTRQGITSMEPGTFTFRMNVVVGAEKTVNIPIDVVIQPKRNRDEDFPILIEAKSAGDFTNTNKRRKEEAQKIRQLRDKYGEDKQLVLFLCGYFDSGYLGYEAAEGLDWIWEHRIGDLAQLGID